MDVAVRVRVPLRPVHLFTNQYAGQGPAVDCRDGPRNKLRRDFLARLHDGLHQPPSGERQRRSRKVGADLAAPSIHLMTTMAAGGSGMEKHPLSSRRVGLADQQPEPSASTSLVRGAALGPLGCKTRAAKS